MYKQFALWIFLLVFTSVKAQELSCSVTVNADQIAVSNNQLFKTLENALTEFVNQTQWTEVRFKQHERIKCAFTILLTEQTAPNTFRGTLQVQASRPVFNATYYSPIFNYQDNSFSFNYTEFQPLNFNLNFFQSNLTSVLAFYSYLILGAYADSFSFLGGDNFLKTALNIANQSQQSGAIGWENKINSITRFTLVDQWLTPKNEAFRKLWYSYHYEAMDVFEKNQKTAATKLVQVITAMKDLYNTNPNNILIRIVTDAKSEELVNIFKKDRGVNTKELVATLKKIAPNNTKKWRQIYTN